MTQTRTKTKARTKRQPRGEARAAPVALAPQEPAKGTENGPRVRAQDVNAYLEAHPEKRAKPLVTKPLPMVVPKSEKDRAAVWKALGHGENAKCPAVDWRDYRLPERLKISSRIEELSPEEREHAARYIAHMRACIHSHHVGRMPAKFPACGWWWCGQKLKPEQWADLLAAVHALERGSMDPNGRSVAHHAYLYADRKTWAKRWPEQKSLCDAVEAQPGFADAVKRAPATARYLLAAETARWAAWPRKGGGHPVDAPLQHLLNETPFGPSPNWKPAVVAAILVLFGLADDERFSAVKHRMEVAWKHPGDLNRRQK